jgi:DtxR family Mn-dependent transcriptional regulator
LKAMVSQGNQKEPDLLAIQQKMGWSNSVWKATWESALEAGWIEETSGKWALTGAGLKRGFELMGAHRTWEQFMVENLGYDKSQVHLQAEQLEHYLTPQLIDEIQSELGGPLKDPHGAYIPQTKATKEISLFALQEGQKALVLTRQPDEHVMAMLWKEGITPNYSITILHKTDKGLLVRINGMEKEISSELANAMQVVRIG